MGRLRTRTVGGTVLLALLLVLAGCSGGGADSTPAATSTATGTPTVTTTDAGTATTSGDEAASAGNGTDADDGNGSGGTVDRFYVFNDSEAYGYEANFGGEAAQMSWLVTSTADASPGLYEDVTVNVSVGQFTTSGTGSQAEIFGEVISDGSVGEPFLYVRTPVVLAAGHDLRVGNSWTVNGSEVVVGDGFEVSWAEATVEITGTATVANETCYTMELRIPGNETGPSSCLRSDWPFALAVDTANQDYRLVEFERP